MFFPGLGLRVSSTRVPPTFFPCIEEEKKTVIVTTIQRPSSADSDVEKLSSRSVDRRSNRSSQRDSLKVPTWKKPYHAIADTYRAVSVHYSMSSIKPSYLDPSLTLLQAIPVPAHSAPDLNLIDLIVPRMIDDTSSSQPPKCFEIPAWEFAHVHWTVLFVTEWMGRVWRSGVGRMGFCLPSHNHY